jgi:hypothetical protein
MWWSIIPTLAVVVAQTQPSPASKWCFERDQGTQLCEQTEEACRKLLDLNTEIARGPCKSVQAPTELAPNPENDNYWLIHL